MRLVRARARIATLYASTSAIVAIDVARWERMSGRLCDPLFDPVLTDGLEEREEQHLAEAQRLAENVVAALARLARHLEA